MLNSIFAIVPLTSLLALTFAYVFFRQMMKSSEGTDAMKRIAQHVRTGAGAYLRQQYKVVIVVFIVITIIFSILAYGLGVQNKWVPFAFITGGAFSGLAGFFGMKAATFASARVAHACRTSLNGGLKLAFRSGAVMGLVVVGLVLMDISIWFLILNHFIEDMAGGYKLMTITAIMLTFGMGASTQALFARVGGGIYTKAADVGADLVGKVEAGIPEDDPRNPATIADNVGDNVGDVAGMGADLFGSYVATVLAAMVLGNYVIRDIAIIDGSYIDGFNNMGPILLPVVIAGVGILASIIGTFLVKIKNNDAEEAQVQKALDTGNWTAIILTLIASYFLIDWMLPDVMNMKFFGEAAHRSILSLNVFWSACIGLAVGALISVVTAYYTSLGKTPVNNIVQNSSTGAGTNIIAGLAVEIKSPIENEILFAAAIYGSYELAGFYGVALAAAAMMATTGMQLAIDAFGPIADNAGGIAEMSELDPLVRERTDVLDSVGNTTAAVGKGFAIASAALTALALFAAYVTFTGIDGINIFRADVLAMLFVGGMVPVVFSALAMESVGKAAMEMVEEVRRQFREIPGIMEGTGTPDYAKCVDISTRAALREMILPGLLTIIRSEE